jgi:DNA-directed RNA polymerase subunit L
MENKISIVNGSMDDAGCLTVQIQDEDHTLGNSLLYMVNKK